METLSEALKLGEYKSVGRCAFLYLPSNYTDTGASIIGRNYDFLQPFDVAAKHLTVTVLYETDKHPVAFISMPGQIYCSTCVNSNNLFIELNNGMPSGGYYINYERESLLGNLLEMAQNSESIEELNYQMKATLSDYSLIINTAQEDSCASYEFSSINGMIPLIPNPENPFSSTNYFQGKDWVNLPFPTDETTWQGVSRKENLAKLANGAKDINIEGFKSLMNTKLSEGGAVWQSTIFQVIYDTAKQDLYLKINSTDADWIQVPLSDYFTLQDGSGLHY
jgi:hypothetical protein